MRDRACWAGSSAAARQARLTLVTPQTKVAGRWLRPAAGRPVVFRFSEPVQVVSLRLAGRRLRRVFARPRSSLATGLTAAGTNAAGEAIVAASPRRWEQLTAPVHVGWFPPGPSLIVLTAPRSGGSLHPLQQLRLTFSQPLRIVFGKHLPRLLPGTAGRWHRPDSHTLVFQPASPGFPLAATISLTLPASVHTPTGRTASRELHWQVLTGSMLRLQQLLAQLGYLPLDWQPALPGATASPASQQHAALHPPAGSFHWRYPNTPPQLAALWHPGRPNLLTRAALTAFEYQHGLRQDGLDSADVWKALLTDATAGTTTRANGYSYILIDPKPPQTLSLWHNGQILITSRVNAGTPTSPIEPGTYTIWQRTARQATSATTPSASKAGQPVSRWLSYYHHDQALHSSNSRSYGHPQTTTNGIELPAPIAYKLWPYTTIGTLLTITH